MFWKKDVLFCDINPTCYAISLQKEIGKRHIKDFLSKEKFAKTMSKQPLPHVITNHSSGVIKRGRGIDLTLQENKRTNIMLACKKLNGLIIYPGEVFSFWKLVGNTTKRKGYLDGRVIEGNKIKPGIGGGLCNLGHTINWLVQHSPLDVIEFHKHSDALAPDHGERIPFTSGTSVSYNNIDYRFKNNTDQPIQLLIWCDEENLHGELRSEREFPWRYQITEENHHFEKEGDTYYRISKIYRETFVKQSGERIEKKLIVDNHSEVMFDYDLIPQEQILKKS